MNTWVTQRGNLEIAGPPLDRRDLEEEVLWPHPPEWIVRFELDEEGWMLDIEITTDDEGARIVTGIVVRAGVRTTPSGTIEDPWPEGGYFEPIVAREVQRLPLGRYVRAALAIVEDPLTGAGRREARRILFPTGTPSERGELFYEQLSAAALELQAQGRDPVAEISKHKRVSANTMHQWMHRVRGMRTSD